jgi:uncharacterized SAM-dependent methyltransferase
MDFYRNSDIAREFNVSNTTVMRWIDGALEGKNNLLVENDGKKVRIIKNQHNLIEIQKLREEGVKFRSGVTYANIKPDLDFYNSFSESEIVEMIIDLQLRKEVNLKYSYKAEGAEIWNNFYNIHSEDQTYLVPDKIKKLLSHIFDLLIQRIPEGTKINIIEMGPGNSKPTIDFLTRLNSLNLLNKYIVVDISDQMIEISRDSFKKALPKVDFESYNYDIERTKFDKIFFDLKNSSNTKVTNVILNVGGTIGNNRNMFEVLRNFQSGMSIGDLLLVSNAIYKPTPIPAMLNFKLLHQQHTWILRRMGFDVDLCEFVNKIDESQNAKIQSLRLDKDYTLEISLNNRIHSIDFLKGVEIDVWRQSRNSLDSLVLDLKECNLNLVGLNTDIKHTHFLAVCESITN